MLFLSKMIDKNSTGFMYTVIFVGFILFTLFIFGLSLVNNIIVVWIVAAFIGLMYGILLPAWNTFMAGHIDPSEQEETWGVFNSVQGFGSMIGPLFGGLIAQFSNGLNNTFYVSALIFLLLAIFMAFILSKVESIKNILKKKSKLKCFDFFLYTYYASLKLSTMFHLSSSSL